MAATFDFAKLKGQFDAAYNRERRMHRFKFTHAMARSLPPKVAKKLGFAKIAPNVADITQATERRLVTVRRIDSLVRMPDSQEHNIATIRGWKVVVKRSQAFTKGEMVLYFETDSFLQRDDARFANCGLPVTKFEGKEGYHVVTISKTSGKGTSQISQGLIFHLDDFPEIKEDWMKLPSEKQATADFAAKLGVTKWELKPEKAVSSLGPFPKFIGKTDIERIQNCPNLFIKAKYKKRLYQESVKMDGSSMTCYFLRHDSQYVKTLPLLRPETAYQPHALLEAGRFGVCSRNCDLRYAPESIYWRAAIHYGLPGKLEALGRNLAVQGELIGATINQNRHDYPAGEHEFFVFGVYDIDECRRWDPREVERFAENLCLEHVPVLGYCAVQSIARCHDDLLCRANLHPDEGLVFKCVEDGRWFKVISNHYLLEHGE